jgi:hypothetical protein
LQAGWVDWSKADLGSQDRNQKFLKLMGAGKGATGLAKKKVWGFCPAEKRNNRLLRIAIGPPWHYQVTSSPLKLSPTHVFLSAGCPIKTPHSFLLFSPFSWKNYSFFFHMCIMISDRPATL